MSQHHDVTAGLDIGDRYSHLCMLEECGHEILVANARKVRLIYGEGHKNDKIDAQKLARLARVDPKLLAPVKHRAETSQAHLALIRSRETLVGATGPKAHYDLVPFGHHILYGAGEVGKGFAIGSGELLGPFYASCFAAGRLIADVVGVDDLLGYVEVARVVKELLHLPAHHGLVLFCRHILCPPFSPASPAGCGSTVVLWSQEKLST